VEEIGRNINKEGQRNAITQLLHAKNKKEKIAAWKLDLDKIVRVFNVRSVV